MGRRTAGRSTAETGRRCGRRRWRGRSPTRGGPSGASGAGAGSPEGGGRNGRIRDLEVGRSRSRRREGDVGIAAPTPGAFIRPAPSPRGGLVVGNHDYVIIIIIFQVMRRLSFHFFLVDGLPAAASIESLPPPWGEKSERSAPRRCPEGRRPNRRAAPLAAAPSANKNGGTRQGTQSGWLSERTREKRGMERMERGRKGEVTLKCALKERLKAPSKSNDKASKMPPGGRKKGWCPEKCTVKNKQ